MILSYEVAERGPVDGRDAIFRNYFTVFTGAVSLVLMPCVLRMRRVEPDHQRVAGDFCDDRGERNDRVRRIAANDRSLCHVYIRCPQSPVKQHGAASRIERELLKRASYASVDAAVDAPFVDAGRASRCERYSYRSVFLHRSSTRMPYFPSARCHLFGIVQPSPRSTRICSRRHRHSADIHRPRERPPSHLIDPDDPLHPYIITKTSEP